MNYYLFFRVVDDWTLLRCMKEDRQIYAIKVVDYLVQENGNGNTTESQDSTLTPDTSGGDVVLPEFPINNPNLMDQGCSATTNTEYQSCVICMEDLPTSELKQHNACDCVICVPCLERTIGIKSLVYKKVSLLTYVLGNSFCDLVMCPSLNVEF